MQALILLPPVSELGELVWKRPTRKAHAARWLSRSVTTLMHCGCDTILVIHPRELSAKLVRAALGHQLLRDASVETLRSTDRFEPADPASWQRVADRLENSFVWFPWNCAIGEARLRELLRWPALIARLDTPSVLPRGVVLIEGIGLEQPEIAGSIFEERPGFLAQAHLPGSAGPAPAMAS